ncbi:MAG: YqiJ family protein, partial [Pseudomonadota bacterium]
LAVMFGIAVLEGITALFGAGFSSFLDTLLPEIDMDGDVPHAGMTHTMTELLGWLHIGKVPVLMLLIIFLTAFGLLGLCAQALLSNTFGMMMPAWLAVVPAFFMSLPAVNMVGGTLSRIMPQDETDAVSRDTFVGRIATVTIGTATKRNPAQAKLTDENGLSHYVMLEPDLERESFHAGDSILIVKKHGAVFSGIRNTSPGMVEG